MALRTPARAKATAGATTSAANASRGTAGPMPETAKISSIAVSAAFSPRSISDATSTGPASSARTNTPCGALASSRTSLRINAPSYGLSFATQNATTASASPGAKGTRRTAIARGYYFIPSCTLRMSSGVPRSSIRPSALTSTVAPRASLTSSPS